MALTAQLRTTTSVPLEVEGLTPDTLRGRSLAAIEKLPLFHGNRPTPLGEFFSIRGSADDGHLVLQGDLSGVHWIGAKMTAGSMRIEGDAGRHLGSQMRGGTIEVTGSASDCAGAEMRGGLLTIRGSAGNLLGSAYRGSPKGMTGGTILVHGSAGHEVGHTLRRGLIAIGGSVGDFVGFSMLAGTIVVAGPPGIRHGANMRRGTVVFLHPQHPPMLPAFRSVGRVQPLFVPLVAKELQQRGWAAAQAMNATFEMFSGDVTEGGRGEILLRAV